MAFALFKDFPAEVRARIWKLNLPGPRIVGFRQREAQKGRYVCYENHFVGDIPVNLHVCKEAREEAQTDYQVILRCEFTQRACYFNAKVDTLHLNFQSGFEGINFQCTLRSKLSKVLGLEKIMLSLEVGEHAIKSRNSVFLIIPKLQQVTIYDSRFHQQNCFQCSNPKCFTDTPNSHITAIHSTPYRFHTYQGTALAQDLPRAINKRCSTSTIEAWEEAWRVNFPNATPLTFVYAQMCKHHSGQIRLVYVPRDLALSSSHLSRTDERLHGVVREDL